MKLSLHMDLVLRLREGTVQDYDTVSHMDLVLRLREGTVQDYDTVSPYGSRPKAQGGHCTRL